MSTEGIQRFKAEVTGDEENGYFPGHVADPEGDWVQWEDVEREFVRCMVAAGVRVLPRAAALAELRGEADELRAEA